MTHDAEVAIVGGGPAGAALAIRLAAAGHAPVVFERMAAARWRAGGVYSSSLTRRRLAELGLPRDALRRLIRPLDRTVVEMAHGRPACTLDHFPEPACGVDRVRLDSALLELARRHGAHVREGAVVRRVELDEREARLLVSDGGTPATWTARVVVGADGPASLVARAAGVAVGTSHFRRAALTGHRADTGAAAAGVPMAARIIVGDGWYLGIAPVPERRVNLGLVLGEPALRRALSGGQSLTDVMDGALAMSAACERWLGARPTDQLAVRLPLAHRVRRAAGERFLLIGDAAGFLDPLSGEGLHRALASARLAERAIARWLRGDRAALSDYDRHLRARFRSKDFASWLLQLFLAQPALAGYAIRRLDRRDRERREFTAVLADRLPASTIVSPGFLVRLLAP